MKQFTRPIMAIRSKEKPARFTSLQVVQIQVMEGETVDAEGLKGDQDLPPPRGGH